MIFYWTAGLVQSIGDVVRFNPPQQASVLKQSHFPHFLSFFMSGWRGSPTVSQSPFFLLFCCHSFICLPFSPNAAARLVIPRGVVCSSVKCTTLYDMVFQAGTIRGFVQPSLLVSRCITWSLCFLPSVDFASSVHGRVGRTTLVTSFSVTFESGNWILFIVYRSLASRYSTFSLP